MVTRTKNKSATKNKSTTKKTPVRKPVRKPVVTRETKASLLARLAAAEALAREGSKASSQSTVTPSINDVGVIDINFHAEIDNNTHNLDEKSLRVHFLVRNMDAEDLLSSLVTLIIPSLGMEGDRNKCKTKLLTEFMHKVQVAVVKELGMEDQIKEKLGDGLGNKFFNN